MRRFILFFGIIFILTSCSSTSHKSVDDKFVGYWKYYTSSFEKGEKSDGSMDGLTANLKKLDGTNETYTFAFIKFDLLFSKKDDTTLEGVDNKFLLKYDESKEHLVLDLGSGSFDEFVKLK